MKRNEGITILQLAITVVIMLIIMSAAIFNGSDAAREAKAAKIYDEIVGIEGALREAELLGQIVVNGNNLELFDECTVPLANMAHERYNELISYNLTGNCYLLEFSTNEDLKNAFHLENVVNNYILELNNLKVYLIEGMDDKHGNKLHSVDDFLNIYENAFVK